MKIFRELLKAKQAKNVLMIIFFFFFFFIRLYRLGYHDFWYDEIVTISYAQYPWGNWNAPFYWVFLHFWVKIFSVSEFSLRFPSLMFSFLSVVLIFFLGKELFNKRTGVIAALLMGLSPFHLWYAQEARDYSMVLFFGILSSTILLKAIRRRRVILWLFFALISLFGLYTNYFFIFLLIAQCGWLVIFERKKINRKAVFSFLIILSGFSLYLSRFLSKFSYVWGGFWIPEPQWKSLIVTFENFMLGYNGTLFLYLVSNILAALFFVFAIIRLRKNKKFRDSFIFCSVLLFMPIVLAFTFSRVFFSVYLDRGLLMFSPYFYLLIAFGVSSLRKAHRIFLLGILIFALAISCCRYFNDQILEQDNHHIGTYIKKPIRPIIDFINNNAGQSDIFAFTNPSLQPSFYFYNKDKPHFRYYFFDPNILDTNWQRPYRESRYSVPFYKINNLEFESLWVLSSDWGRSGELDENSRSVKFWLDNNFQQELKKEFDGLWVFKYVRKKR